jgi:hypothetical protein
MSVSISLVFSVLTLVACAPSLSGDRIRQAQMADVPLLVTAITTSSPNSAGGVDVSFQAVNVGEREIKYVSFGVIPFNRVGDVVSSSIGNRREFRGLYTGPLRSGQSISGLRWRNAWYNYSIVCAELKDLSVTFMDDSVVWFELDRVQMVLANPEVNNCRLR